MKYKKAKMSVLLFLVGLGSLHAQESPTATGGEATGSGGIISYSVGQVIYTTNSGANGSVAQGVQQPYEISTTVGIDVKTINLELSIFPNPTQSEITLKVEDVEGLTYQVFDMNGKLIESKTVTKNSTLVNLENQESATYLIKVSKDNSPIKTFRVVKN